MNGLMQDAVLVGLSRRLSQKGSWAGETHLQKAAYLLSELRNVDFDFDFILYKHGPFSFELRDELAYMRSEGLLETVVPNPRYGPQLLPSEEGKAFEEMLEVTQRYGDALDWVVNALGKRGVMDLERLATAMWMTRNMPKGSVRARAEALVKVKPHIPLEAASSSVEEIDSLLEKAEKG